MQHKSKENTRKCWTLFRNYTFWFKILQFLLFSWFIKKVSIFIFRNLDFLLAPKKKHLYVRIYTHRVLLELNWKHECMHLVNMSNKIICFSIFVYRNVLIVNILIQCTLVHRFCSLILFSHYKESEFFEIKYV